ncbi:myelin-associated glycoprotein-like [Takifugu flavidus]|uniref:myelin-associated glycoprotein-like n=1 Tax=Takifugu flavidus TaxID=433684 RepID=UPI0025448467|nr:myelin-associated glycoprotein-like [Takifugu flavidus]XP_056901542.1 myelin-associated glycoprotein-like [Takifugu flavidus]
MASLKWTLCLLYFKVILTETKHWSINVPSSIKGLNGSCVVIPCSFDFPDSKNDLKFTGMWKDGSDQLIYHSVKSKIMQTYWNRTELLGNLAHKNCSLKIDPLKDSDGGPFHFRVEIDKLDKFSYKDNKVSILMISEPDPISLSIKGQVRKDRSTSAVCFVTHSCPTSPPVFTWSHAGSQKVQHTPVKDGQWKAISTLRFQATKEDNNKHLRCRVTYKGGQQQEAASLLEVIFAPEISNTSHCTSGAKLTTCVCIAESSSPSRVQFVLSGRILDSTDMKTHDRVTIGILRVQQGPYEFIHCLANSTAGRANLTLSVIHLHSARISNLYILIAIGGGTLLLILQILLTCVQKCFRISCLYPNKEQSDAAPTSQLKSNKALPLHKKVSRKEDGFDGNGGQGFMNHVYDNIQTCTEEPIYANM